MPLGVPILDQTDEQYERVLGGTPPGVHMLNRADDQ